MFTWYHVSRCKDSNSSKMCIINKSTDEWLITGGIVGKNDKKRQVILMFLFKFTIFQEHTHALISISALLTIQNSKGSPFPILILLHHLT